MPVVEELWESLRSCPPKEVMVAFVSKAILNGGEVVVVVVEGVDEGVVLVKVVKWWASC